MCDENKVTPKFLRRYMSLPAALAVLESKQLNLGDYRHWEDASERAALEAYEARMFSKDEKLHLLCFTQASETYHHWKIYAESGICFAFRGEHLLAQCDSLQFTQQKMKYVRVNELVGHNKVEDWPFLKRWPFRGEEEYRIFGKKGDFIPLTLEMLERIYISPWIPEDITDVLKGMLSKWGANSIKVCRTTLLKNKQWMDHFKSNAMRRNFSHEK